MQDGSQFLTPVGFKRVAADAPRVHQRAPVRIAHADPGVEVSFSPVNRTAGDWYRLELRFPPDGVIDVLAQFVFAGGRVLWLRLPVVARNHFATQLRLDGVLERLNLHVTGSGRLSEPTFCRFQRVGLVGQLATAARRGRDILKRDGLGAIWSAMNYFWRLSRPGSIVMSRGSASAAGEAPYDTWMRVFDEVPERDLARHHSRLATLSNRPLISIVTTHQQADTAAVDRMARCLRAQVYPAWELVVAAPGSVLGRLRASLSGIADGQIRLIESASPVAASFNALLAKLRGDYLLPIAASAVLRRHALLEFAMTINRHPAAELIYSDEDRIDASGRRSDPHFKPAWSPELLAAYEYFGDAKLLRTATVRALGGWRDQASDAQHDLMLRLASSVEPTAIVHLAKILVHAPAELAEPLTLIRPHSALPTPVPLVSLIIPTRDNAAMLETCIRSIRDHTRYPNYEILIVDNGSVEQATKRLFAQLAEKPRVRVISRPGPFNFSAINNSAVHDVEGDIVGLINNDIEAIEDGWLDEMVALAARAEIGCVGARLLYPDGRLQHGGVIVGLGGVAGHAHRFAPSSEQGYLKRLSAIQNVSAVTAACLLVRRRVFEQVGGFDEGLAVAFNDVDFCLKVRDAGYRNLWTPFATLIHHESLSRGRDFTLSKARRFADEHSTMQKRWGADLWSDPYYSPHLTYDREDFSVRLR